MAETTVFPGPTSEVPPPPASKNPPGRPRKDGLPAGSALAPVNPTDADDFFLTLTGFTEDQWKYRYVYLYRLYPITDRRAAGNPIWINKYPQPFNREDVLRDHGSGIYKAELLESLPTQAGKRLAVSIFQILNTDYPPKIPAGEWVDDPKNADWEWCRPKLGPHVANGATVVQQGVSPTELVNTMLRFKEATDRPEPKDSTSELITTILSSPLIAKLIPENKPPAEDKSLVMLLNMMQEDRKLMQQQLIELQKQMMTPKPPEKNWLEASARKRRDDAPNFRKRSERPAARRMGGRDR